MDNWWRIIAIALLVFAIFLLALLAWRLYIGSLQIKKSKRPTQPLAIESSNGSKTEILEGEILDNGDEWPGMEDSRLDTDELPIFGRYSPTSNSGAGSEHASHMQSSYRKAHIRFFIEYAAYTAAYLASLAILVAVAIGLWNSVSDDTFRLVLLFAAVTIALVGLWPLSVMMRRSDAKWDASTTPPREDDVFYSRQLHISMLAHSILLQAGIWIIAFIVTSWALHAVEAAIFWHVILQLIVTVINMFFVYRTLTDWRLRLVTVTSKMFIVTQPDILALFLTGDRSANQERRTLIGSGIGERTLTERFAYRTRGTIIIRTQETSDGGSTVVKKYPYISNVEALAAALRSDATSN